MGNENLSRKEGNISSRSCKYNEALTEIIDIRTIGLACRAPSNLEKLFWILLGIGGFGWSVYFISQQFLIWSKNPLIIQKSDVQLNEIYYPAMTICSQTSTRYAVAERLGNYIDPENIPKDLLSLFKRMKMCPIQCTLNVDEICFDTDYLGNVGVKFDFRRYYNIKCEWADSEAKGCKPMKLLYKYSLLANQTMKEIFYEAIKRTKDCGSLAYDCIKQKVLQFATEKTLSITQSEELNLGRSYKYWKYVAALVRLYSRIQEEDWKVNDIGSFFIKILNSANSKLSGKWRWASSCGSIREDVLGKLHEIFGNFGEGINMLELAYLYTLNDFSAALEKERKISTDGINGPSGLLPPPSNLMHFNAELVSCIKEIANQSEHYDKEKPFYSGKVHKHMTGIHHSPCQSLKEFPICRSYCNWHQAYFTKKQEEEFSTIMKYALPQRKMVMASTMSEKQLAKKVFGNIHLRENAKLSSPSAMILFCHKVIDGFYGENIGIVPNICNDFFPTPTDQGICLTSNLQLEKIMKTTESMEDLFETTKQLPNSNINGGTLYSEITLVIFTDSANFLSQSYQRKSDIKLGEIHLQLHQSNEFAKIMTSNDYKTDLIPLTLIRGVEYYIKVNPTGQIVSQGVSNLDPKQRKCYLEDEVSSPSVFKVYTRSNCKYECEVALAQEQCKCIPWDFFVNEKKYQECDLFGRSCFFEAMQHFTQSPENHCKHCFKECNYIEYNKVMEKARSFMGSETEHRLKEAFSDFFLDKNNTLVEEGFKRGFDTFMRRGSLLNEGYNTWRKDFIGDLIVVHLNFQKPEISAIDLKYSTDDKFANFGGSFGIFAEITGCSFLGLLNIFIISLKILLTLIKTKEVEK